MFKFGLGGAVGREGKGAENSENEEPNSIPYGRDWVLALTERAQDLFCLCRDGRIAYINPAGARMLGCPSAQKATGEKFSDFVHPDYRETVCRFMDTLTAKSEPVALKIARADGTDLEAEILILPGDNPADREITIHGRDITQRNKSVENLHGVNDRLERGMEEAKKKLSRAMDERRRAEDRLRLTSLAIENLDQGVVGVDADYRVISVNRAFTEITGYAAKEVLGKPPHFHIHSVDTHELQADMRRGLEKDGAWEGEFWNKRKQGQDYAEHLTITVLPDEQGKAKYFSCIISDVTRRKEDEERIRYQANYDTLTGLPNRALFLDRLGQALSNAARTGKQLGLLFIGLDGFKEVNDTLGYDTGDLLLKQAAKRLGNCIWSGDTVARLGGDEFTVIMPNLAHAANAPLLGQRILDSLSEAFRLDGEPVAVTASIGITIYPDDASEATELLKNADTALFRAKEEGKANYQFFTADLNHEVRERLALKTGLNSALRKGELSLHYQPKLDLASNTIPGAEALMRWNSAELGPVSPAKFIPVLEETGMIIEVGEWALRTACEQHRSWLAAGLPKVRIAVNLSARQLREENFVSRVEEIMRETGMEPAGLEVEITESMLMSDSARSVTALSQLNEMGIHVAMDDFGTGYSSLSYLKRFPIDTIKIDQSFVADIATTSDDLEIIRAIINMGQTLNRRVVAEGVETQDQLDILRQLKCDEIQGYFFCRPKPADQAGAFIREYAANR